MDAEERLKAYFRIFYGRLWLEGPEALNPAELAVACIPEFEMALIDGCFWSFFYNPSGAFTEETIASLMLIGATLSASLLTEAKHVYFAGRPVPQDQLLRQGLMKEVNGDHTPEADRISHEIYEIQEFPSELLESFVRSHESELKPTENEVISAIPIEGDWRQCTHCCDAWELPASDKLEICPSCRTLTFLRVPSNDPGKS